MSDISEEYLSNIYKDVIMDHFRNPRNSVEIEEYDHELFSNRGLNYVLKYDIKIGVYK